MEEQASFFDTVCDMPARTRFAERYRGLIGVVPEQRDALRGSLRAIIASSRNRIETIIGEQPTQPNTSPASATGERTGSIPTLDD